MSRVPRADKYRFRVIFDQSDIPAPSSMRRVPKAVATCTFSSLIIQ